MFPEHPHPSISVIICTLNEADNLPHVLPELPHWIDEVVLVDGHSTDGTVQVAQELYPNVLVFYQKGKGKGDALQCAFEHVKCDIVVTLDADGATPPRYIHKFVESLLYNYDFAKGSRFIKGSASGKPFHRTLGNFIITFTFDLLFLKIYTDICSGYNAFWRQSMKNVNLSWADGYENEPLIHARFTKAKSKVIEVGYNEEPRINGEVKETSWRQGPKAIKTILRERFSE